jgi:hypothetical protein
MVTQLITLSAAASITLDGCCWPDLQVLKRYVRIASAIAGISRRPKTLRWG